VKNLFARLKARRWRVISADAFMLAFILLTGVGAYMILPAAGFITAGVTCGLYGYLLGSE
jgi:uncharacterized membrane protein